MGDMKQSPGGGGVREKAVSENELPKKVRGPTLKRLSNYVGGGGGVQKNRKGKKNSVGILDFKVAIHGKRIYQSDGNDRHAGEKRARSQRKLEIAIQQKKNDHI